MCGVGIVVGVASVDVGVVGVAGGVVGVVSGVGTVASVVVAPCGPGGCDCVRVCENGGVRVVR